MLQYSYLRIKFLLSLLISSTDGKSEHISNGLDLLEALQKHGVISEKEPGLTSLCTLFNTINRNDLVRKVETFKNKQSGAVLPPQTPKPAQIGKYYVKPYRPNLI